MQHKATATRITLVQNHVLAGRDTSLRLGIEEDPG